VKSALWGFELKSEKFPNLLTLLMMLHNGKFENKMQSLGILKYCSQRCKKHSLGKSLKCTLTAGARGPSLPNLSQRGGGSLAPP